MADVQFENFVLASTNNAFSAVWKWTRALKKAGWTYLSSSDGTTKDTTGIATNDKWGGAADPANDGYPTALDTVNAWWNAQGPTTLMLSMTSAPTGSFVRGEKVTQATSGAEGEFQGFDFDGVSQGHAVIFPRTGTFDGTHTVTGAVSGATFTPTALFTIVREIVIFKSTDKINGSIYFQTIINETENANRFSVLAAQSSCTATVAPGAGATTSNNSFPQVSATTIAAGSNGVALPTATINVAATQNAANQPIFPTAGTIQVVTTLGTQNVTYTGTTGTTFTGCSGGIGTMATGNAVTGPGGFGSWAMLGAINSGTILHSIWFGNLSVGMGVAQIVATNIIGATGVTPDGTAWVIMGDTVSPTQCQMFGVFRCDDCEDADVDPFVTFRTVFNITGANPNVRTDASGSSSSLNGSSFFGLTGTANSAFWKGWRRRGFPSEDVFAVWAIGLVAFFGGGNVSQNVCMESPQTKIDQIGCAYTQKKTRDRFFVINQDPTKKGRKGTLRWISTLGSNTTYDMLDGRTKMVMIAFSNGSNPSIVIGPLDGSTIVAQTA